VYLANTDRLHLTHDPEEAQFDESVIGIDFSNLKTSGGTCENCRQKNCIVGAQYIEICEHLFGFRVFFRAVDAPLAAGLQFDTQPSGQIHSERYD
jgi:hypothetical protein